MDRENLVRVRPDRPMDLSYARMQRLIFYYFYRFRCTTGTVARVPIVHPRSLTRFVFFIYLFYLLPFPLT
jgi:hypothetical protein